MTNHYFNFKKKIKNKFDKKLLKNKSNPSRSTAEEIKTLFFFPQ